MEKLDLFARSTSDLALEIAMMVSRAKTEDQQTMILIAFFEKMKRDSRRTNMQVTPGELYNAWKDGPCVYCGEPTNRLAANPGDWNVPLPTASEPGVVRPQHMRCVLDRLRAPKLCRHPEPFKIGRGETTFDWCNLCGSVRVIDQEWFHPHGAAPASRAESGGDTAKGSSLVSLAGAAPTQQKVALCRFVEGHAAGHEWVDAHWEPISKPSGP